MDEHLIIGLILKRNPRGLEQLMKEMNRNVYALTYKIIGGYCQREDIEELVSDVLFYVWGNICSYDTTKGSLKTWIYTLTKYRALDWKRRNKRLLKMKEDFETLHAVEETSSSYVWEVDLMIDISSAATSLNKEELNLLIRRCFLDESLEEIASDQGTTRGALDTQLWRIRNKIKNFMEGKEE